MESAAPQMSSPPAGDPRFVAAFYQPTSGWTVAAESTTREPVDYAVAAMIQTVRSRGQAPLVEIWGPAEGGDDWRHIETIRARSGRVASHAEHHSERPEQQPVRSARDERLRDRRHQVLTAALAAAGLTDLHPEDDLAITELVDATEESTIRRIAHWLSAANGEAGEAGEAGEV
ncbi:hypothetical protein NGB36_29075 [Streptomyces sp. RB6PN25]|uniref:Uncharacterized protein n=1 Tax=Streptomyces humicola TaxID=2953240 RepID=A0ABT1Q6W9_9ACTN|nr:hypothetical protein [Streptomyces humicola]MCQ4084517.1 hypothetical protein [Streptomyces humicola]